MKKLLFPLAWGFGLALRIRHFLFDKGVFPIHKFPVKTIGVGNLAMGGTGKSVVVEALLKGFKKGQNLAVLSRGYKRKTKGFMLANATSTAQSIGDEPYQFFQNHPEVQVAVCEQRAKGIHALLQQKNPPTAIILDDVMQHRWVEVDLLLLTTTFDALYTEDSLFPVGTLRDLRQQAKRAHLVLVTKCPQNLTAKDAAEINQRLACSPSQKIFFTTIAYGSKVLSATRTMELADFIKKPFVLVTGIAKPKPLIDFLTALGAEFEWLNYPDHHSFSKRDLKKIQNSQYSTILTTEKDFGRLSPRLSESSVYYLPIGLSFLFEEEAALFEQTLKRFLAT
ncbi:MAG: tetraacyldisaccharide 4'-kinase [Flavobacteriaceae bacterium]